jgi:lysophospholipase L1-like esterase
VGTSTVTCSTRDAAARTASCTFPVVVQPPPKLTVTSFLAFGDSITWGEDGTAAVGIFSQHIFVQLPSGQPYPDALQAELQSRYKQQTPTVRNDGYPGESLSDGLTPSGVDCSGGSPSQSGAFQRYVHDIALAPYGALLLMEGSNDVNAAVGDGCLLGKAINVERAIIEDAKGRGVHVILGTIPPMVPPGFNGRAKGYLLVPTYNGMVKALAGTEAVPVADVYTAFGSDASTLIGFDGLHPNAAGYQRIADTFLGTIKSSLEVATTSASRAALRRR